MVYKTFGNKSQEGQRTVPTVTICRTYIVQKLKPFSIPSQVISPSTALVLITIDTEGI